MRDNRTERSFAVAAVIQAIPPAFTYFTVAWLSLFMLIAMGLNFTQLPVFFTYVLFWCQVVIIVAGVLAMVLIGIWFHHTYHDIIMKSNERKGAREKVKKLFLQNEVLAAKVEMERQLPLVLRYAMEQGHNVEYGSLKVSNYLSNLHMLQNGGTQELLAAPAGALPTSIRYEDIRNQVPKGHVLVGIGANNVVETKEGAVGACVWIVGLSGTGKTSTTVLRVEERATEGHTFLGIDPHWFKPDSLSNAIVGYSERFIQPPARNSQEALVVLNLFLDEFNGRKAGRIPQPWKPITLLVDEVNALMDAQTDDEKQIKELLPTIARVCGQEARNFMMGGIFISQQGTLLAWLRKVALMIIVHQLLMESEKRIALNGDSDAMEDMKSWPIGRTYVYGVGFQEGPRTVQQPFFETRTIGQWSYTDLPPVEVEEDASDLDRAYDACESLKDQGLRVTARSLAAATGFGKTKAAELLQKLREQGTNVC